MNNNLPVIVLYVESTGTTRVVVNGEEICQPFACTGDARLAVDVLYPERFELRIEEGVR